MKAIVLYHKDDNDGVFSGALMHYYLTHLSGKQIESVDCIGVDYNDLRAYTREKLEEMHSVYGCFVMTDVSLPVELIDLAYELWVRNFIWIDHHAPIIQAVRERGLNNRITGIRATNESALYHAFDFCICSMKTNKEIVMPRLLKILSAIDSWHYDEFDKELCRAVNSGVSSEYKLNFDAIVKLIEENGLNESDAWNKVLNHCQEIGNIIVERSKQRDAELIARSGDYNWVITDVDGKPLHTACALFIQGPSSSLIFETADEERAQCGLIFKHNPDTTWTISLYNTREKFDKEFHAGQWCREKFQGGGHAGAAGCTITQEQFIEALKTRRI